MKKEELKKYLGQNVNVSFYDGTVISGILGYTPEFSEEYGWRKPGYFTVGNTDFKVSHVKGISLEPMEKQPSINYKEMLEELDR